MSSGVNDRTTLAIDAGQTGIRASLSTDAASTEPREFPGIRTDLALEPQLAAVVATVAGERGIPVDIVAVGSTGFTSAASAAGDLLALVRELGVSEVLMAHDSVTSFLGALGDTTGAITAVGTGVVTFAVGDDSVARVDGWGYIMGDAGSGYWIGRAALDAVMRAHDGRGPATALTDVVRAEYPDLEGAYVALQSDEGRVRRVASFARAVSDLAAGDDVAASICHAAGDELAHSVVTGLRRVGLAGADAPVVCALGGIMRSEAVSRAFEEHLRAEWPHADLRAALGTGLDGAALLPHLAPDSALRELVVRAAG